MNKRRFFLRQVAHTSAGVLLGSSFLSAATRNALTGMATLPDAGADDDTFWEQVKQAYTVNANMINLNNGGVSPQPRAVQEAVEHYNRLSNETPSYYMWRILDQGREPVRDKLAALAGCSPEEIAINRNSSEALETVIFGLPLKAGDEVVLTKQDYPNMINAWKQREHRDGIVLKWINLELPIEDEKTIVDAFASAITPRTRILHVTHMINWTGQILPAKALSQLAAQHGIEVLLDAAHTFAHFPYDIKDLGVTYMGTSLHKWLCAPFGSGMLYIQKDKIGKIYPLLAAPDPTSEDIRKFENLGTRSFAIEQGIGHAVEFHHMIGTERKGKRLHYLKNYWVEQAQSIPGFQLHTSLKPEWGCALSNFSLEGRDIGDLSSFLYNKYKVHTVPINWENIHGIRVTPNVYTATRDLDRFVEGIWAYTKT
ncbi:MAG TPA: aminotransferase class V-fold PLP-dependent enzyme [Saprospiraceae bacterium]|nr:aminotransferase class V-fold PLP-dependent enzyme [Saprospiraceae bacterium]HPG08713.1 aminotransferase class V-fold PLP-dependent enzyme [Saprospiraceae bacterium]HRV85527.1 aminotransferase class V-fold PLP-dependent enzyme [Saprospiraceae bacterium]